jgi:hypothetical protein
LKPGAVSKSCVAVRKVGALPRAALPNRHALQGAEK